MRTSLKRISAIFGFSILLGAGLFSCSKDDDKILQPEQVAFFMPTPTVANYRITNAEVYKIPVGLTAPLSSGKTLTVNISSSSTTGAVEGTEYTYNKTVSFAANKITDTIYVQASLAKYLAGEKDTIKFTFSDPNVASPSLNNSFTLNIAGPCFEGDIVFADLVGSYGETYENGSYGPYTSTITDYAPGSAPNTAKANINNIYDNDITAQATFDYSTIGSFTVTVAPQATGFTVGGLPLFVRTTPGTTSTFTYCTPSFTINLDLYTSNGLYDRWVMTMDK